MRWFNDRVVYRTTKVIRKGKISAEIFNPDGIMIETIILKVVYDLK